MLSVFNDSMSFETMTQSRTRCNDARHDVQMTKTYVMTFTWGRVLKPYKKIWRTEDALTGMEIQSGTLRKEAQLCG